MSAAEFVDLVDALAWPVVVVAALVVFREPLLDILRGRGLGRRLTKVSAFQVALELAPLPELIRAESDPFISTVQQLNRGELFVSDPVELMRHLSPASGAYDYAVIDLGTGERWLTSHLFIFALMLERMRGLQWFVFLETSGEVRRRFIGTATPAAVRWALAQRYPWLEAAFAHAYAQVAPALPSPAGQDVPVWIHSGHGALDVPQAGSLVQAFLGRVQQTAEPPNRRGWVSLENRAQPGSPPTWVHASWLDGDRLERLLDTALQVDAWFVDSLDLMPAARVQAVLRRDGAVVARVQEGGRFTDLIDRQALLEQAAIHVADSERAAT